MTHHITAYEGTNRLIDCRGETILELSPSRIQCVGGYRIPGWGDTAAMVYKLPNNRGWIVGYSLGEGCLFRGEYLPPQWGGFGGKRFQITGEQAAVEARITAEYWIERDAEDQEEFDREEAVNQSYEDLADSGGIVGAP